MYSEALLGIALFWRLMFASDGGTRSERPQGSGFYGFDCILLLETTVVGHGHPTIAGSLDNQE